MTCRGNANAGIDDLSWFVLILLRMICACVNSRQARKTHPSDH